MSVDYLLRQFDSRLDTYRAFTTKLHSLIEELLRNAGVKVHSVTSRTKDRPSFETKVSKVPGRYRDVVDITDIVGVRVVTHLEEDVARVAQLVGDEFDIDTTNSVDKRLVLDPERFGYASLHYVVALPKQRNTLAEYSRFAGLKAEIQIRSILQHAWAEIEHDLGYKSNAGVPRQIRRQFSRLAGLLELADEEFNGIKRRLATYERDVATKIGRDPSQVAIDKASLQTYVEECETVASVSKDIARERGAALLPAARSLIEPHVAVLTAFGIATIGDLDSAMWRDRLEIIRFASSALRRVDARTMGATVSLYYFECLLLVRSPNPELASIFVRELGPPVATPEEFLATLMKSYFEMRSTA